MNIIISADNCTDRTVEIARSFPGVIVRETVGNTFKKAGALNQAWDAYGRESGYVFTMDADTVLAPDCVEQMKRILEEKPDLGGVSAWPCLKPSTAPTLWTEFVYRMIRLNYGGCKRLLRSRNYRTDVLAGAGTLLRGNITNDVASLHGGSPWMTNSIVEDYRISLDVRSLGHKIEVVPEAVAYTDPLTGLKQLWKQRVRWSSGTWQEIGRIGWKSYTWRVWMNLIASLSMLLARILIMGVLATIIYLGVDVRLTWIFAIPFTLSVLDALDTLGNTPGTDKKDIFIAITIIPLEAFALLQQAWIVWSLGRVLRRKGMEW
jgi:poly-beta-1,6-N-acetyl-D-glucosamine synthase